MKTQQQEAETFLRALWEGVPEPHKFLTWTLDRKYSLWWNDPAEAAEAVAGKPNEYVGVGLADPTQTRLIMTERAKANEISGIAGFGLDIDYQDGAAHKGKKLPPDEASAHQLLDAMPLRPTLVVHSGHGLQAWWLLKEHLIFDGVADRMAAANVARDWNATLAAKAKQLGWEVDSVHDLARVLRIPGTINTKGGVSVPARLLVSDGPRYADLDEFAAVCVQAPADTGKAGPKFTDAPRSVDFWTGVLEGSEEGGRNNAMAALAGLMFNGMKDVADEKQRRLMLKFFQLVNERNSPPLEDRELNATFFSILKKEIGKRAAEEACIELEQSEMYAEEGPSEERLRILSGMLSEDKLELAKITKKGREGAEYAITLKNGETVTLGAIVNQDQVRKAILDHTAGTPSPVVIRLFKKPEWLAVCRRMAAAAEEIDMPEYSRAYTAGSSIGSYLETRQGAVGLPTFDDMIPGALQSGAPFVEGGMVHVTIQDLVKTLRATGDKWNERDWVNGLHDLGFERFTVSRTFGEGQRKQKKYWRVDASILEQKCGVHCFAAEAEGSRDRATAATA
jgi:hypothetical protein